MRNKINPYWLIALISLSFFFSLAPSQYWGFFGHRRINRLAVFTLPSGMVPFYKKHIEYLTEHAVDPDKRRYATKHEAVRHYIDLDRYPESLPLRWEEAIAEYIHLYAITPFGDTVQVFSRDFMQKDSGVWRPRPAFREKFPATVQGGIREEEHRSWVSRQYLSKYYQEELSIPCDSLRQLYGRAIPCERVLLADSLSPHGILPYHLLQMHRRLTNAFRSGNRGAVLQLSAEIGHYIGDAHVPLHTTMNYNGQMTGQTGIHAFWESRIPELFADTQYDFFVGQAVYIRDPARYYWDMVQESHVLVDSVLKMEEEVRRTYPKDLQFCPNEKITGGPRVPCQGYAAAYQAKLNGMVERRMRAAILAIGSAWYSAWSDAGQPPLHRFKTDLEKSQEGMEETKGKLPFVARPHQ